MSKAPRPYRLFIARGSLMSGVAELVPDGKEKRFKRKCYSEHEIHVLLKLVEKHRDIIENKETKATSNALKHATWEKVHAEFIATPGTGECKVGQLQMLWKNLKRKSKRLGEAGMLGLIAPMDSDAGSSIETASVSEDASRETPPIKIEIESETEDQEKADTPSILPTSSSDDTGLKLKNPRTLPRYSFLQRHRQPMLRAEARVARVEEELLAMRERLAQDELRELARKRAATEAQLTEEKLRLEIKLLQERLERERTAAEERMRMDREEHELRMRLMYGKVLDKK